MATKPKAHVAKYKKDSVKEFFSLMKEYPVVGVINMQNLPAAQLAKLRGSLRGKAIIFMGKKRLMNIAFKDAEQLKKGIIVLQKEFPGIMPALLFTKENPFSIYKILQKSKSEAPAKPGQISPKDIVIQPGPTPFAPGPVIGELGAVGIKAGIEAGKVVIKQEKVVVRKGEKISDKVCSIITRLGIKPMEIGLDLVAVYENGTVFSKDVLSIDEAEFLGKIKNAATSAINLSVFAAYPCKDNIKLLIGKTARDSRAISISQGIVTKETIKDLLARADRECVALQAKAS